MLAVAPDLSSRTKNSLPFVAMRGTGTRPFSPRTQNSLPLLAIKLDLAVHVPRTLDILPCRQPVPEAVQVPPPAVTYYPGMEVFDATPAWLQSLEQNESGVIPVGLSTAEEAALERTAYYSEQTRLEPGNVALWIQYVAFQPEATHAAGAGFGTLGTLDSELWELFGSGMRHPRGRCGFRNSWNCCFRIVVLFGVPAC